MRGDFCSVNLKYLLINLRDRCKAFKSDFIGDSSHSSSETVSEFHSDDHYDDAMTMSLFEFSEPGNTSVFTRHILN